MFCDFYIIFPYSEEEEEESEEEGEDPTLDSLSQAIAFQVSVQIKKMFEIEATCIEKNSLHLCHIIF